MQLLLDTHSFLWFISGDSQLSSKSKEEILKNENRIFVSIVSLWEIAIKINIKKLSLKSNFDFLFKQIEENSFRLLHINKEYLNFYIPLLFHHRDPFDRMLISQGIFENMTIVSKDPDFKKYNVKVLW